MKVVAVAVFLALGFAFYVFFAPFVGKKMYQYIAMGLYTPLVTQYITFFCPFFFQIFLCKHSGVFTVWSKNGDLCLLLSDLCVWLYVSVIFMFNLGCFHFYLFWALILLDFSRVLWSQKLVQDSIQCFYFLMAALALSIVDTPGYI